MSETFPVDQAGQESKGCGNPRPIVLISVKDPQRYPWMVRKLLQHQTKTHGFPFKPTLAWGMRPVLFLLFTLFYKALDRKRSPLTPEERSLLMVRISNLNHCAFCIDLNSFNLLNRSGNGEKLDRLPNWRTESLYSNRERALLAFTDAVTRNENTEEAVAGLKTFFDDGQIVEITALVSFQNLSTKFNSALGIEAQGICKVGGGKG